MLPTTKKTYHSHPPSLSISQKLKIINKYKRSPIIPTWLPVKHFIPKIPHANQ